jgi:hypothetical protein
MNNITTSSKKESVKDILLSATWMSAIIAWNQFFHRQQIEQILTSAWWQFSITAVNWYFIFLLLQFVL